MEKRSESLDILRAIAILLVLGAHLGLCHQKHAFLYTVVTLWNTGGWVGVDLFFVLSGFLISGLLFKEHQRSGSISFKRFFIRRGFKIYPSFYFLILVTVLIKVIFGHGIIRSQLLSELFFLQDYIRGMWLQTWSLGVEEKFYILLPVLLIFLIRIHRSKDKAFDFIPKIFIFISIACLGIRILTSITMPYTNLTHMWPFHLRIDSLFFGVLISYFYHYHPSELTEMARRFKYLLLGLGIILFIPAFIFNHRKVMFIYTAGLTFVYLGSGLILISSLGWSIKKNLFKNGLALIGRHSYSIYLWHMAASSLSLSLPLPPPPYRWPTYAVTYFLGAILFGIVISKIIEYPMLKLRDRIFPSKEGTVFPQKGQA